MDEIDLAKALQLLDGAMPELQWRKSGNTGLATIAELNEEAALQMAHTIKERLGLTGASEPVVRQQGDTYSIAIDEPLGATGVTAEVVKKLEDEMTQRELDTQAGVARAATMLQNEDLLGLEDKTAIHLLNNAMPGVTWAAAGRAGIATKADLSEKEANALSVRLKERLGLSNDAEPYVEKLGDRYAVIIGDPVGPDGITPDVGRRLLDPVTVGEMQDEAKRATAESPSRTKSEEPMKTGSVRGSEAIEVALQRAGLSDDDQQRVLASAKEATRGLQSKGTNVSHDDVRVSVPGKGGGRSLG